MTPSWSVGPCDAIQNMQNMLSAMFDISARIRLSGSFIGLCTYIPFLIRWDLVPDWEGPSNIA